LQAVHVRHVDVHGDHVGLERLSLSYSVAAIARFSADFKLGIGGDDALQHFAHERRVIHNQHPDFLSCFHQSSSFQTNIAPALSAELLSVPPISLPTAAKN